MQSMSHSLLCPSYIAIALRLWSGDIDCQITGRSVYGSHEFLLGHMGACVVHLGFDSSKSRSKSTCPSQSLFNGARHTLPFYIVPSIRIAALSFRSLIVRHTMSFCLVPVVHKVVLPFRLSASLISHIGQRRPNCQPQRHLSKIAKKKTEDRHWTENSLSEFIASIQRHV